MLRIIDNKKIDLTPDEYKEYERICKSYTTKTMQGEDLFKNLFETDKLGIIKIIKPPSSNFTSMEVFLFIISIFVRQNVGLACSQSDDMTNLVKKELVELQNLKFEIKKELERLSKK